MSTDNCNHGLAQKLFVSNNQLRLNNKCLENVLKFLKTMSLQIHSAITDLHTAITRQCMKICH